MHLSWDILVNIFLRLRVKTLLICRRVCKYWNDTISSSDFLKFHNELSISNPCHKVLVTFPLSTIDFNACRVKQEAKRQNWIKIPWMADFADDFKLLGSCNGLICLGTKSNSKILWNPSTGDYQIVTPQTSGNFRGSQRPYFLSGFGINPSTGGYTIVLGCYYWDNLQQKRAIYIITQRRGRYECKRIQDIPGTTNIYQRLGVSVNGHLHWPASVQNESVVLSYNLAEEKIRSIPLNGQAITELPDLGLSLPFPVPFTLGTCEGHLCTISKPWDAVVQRKDTFELWVMKEYGVWKSWTWLNNIEGIGDYGSLLPLGFFENGDLMVDADSTHIKRYSFKDKSARTLQILNNLKSCSISYVETMVAPR
ncbi:F-box/kelch-repeat protein At3g06240-like [Coffea eugenioides]|uniref:F-box/kelch-repeat protein At3g06240-like n=1 Tax=Coffea eugenioides TaxID=49369 RepID=UPI000F613BA2|nr:F-box/kelch-repeat protein At3g06240-like [Coffea eugenioides]